MKVVVKKLFTGFLILQLVVLGTIPVSAQEVTPTPDASATVSTETTSPQGTTESPSPEVTTSTEVTTPSQPSSEVSNSSTPSIISETPTPSTDSEPTNSNPLSNWNNLTDQQKDAYRESQKEKAETQYLASQGLIKSPSGEITVATGDANSGAAVTNFANNNFSSSPAGGSGGSASVINSNNGAYSNNDGSATIANNGTTNQDNSAHVVSGLDQSSTTGNNNAGFNVGDSTLATGDANTTGTLINAVNTNVDGVMVSEFNIVDDHVGDIVLDFAANCISGCGLLGLSSQNSGNGASSTNTANTDVVNNNTTFQNNTGTVGNEMVLGADSGNNSSSYNTNGDSTITTGDANIAGNALTFLNNNIAGNVVFSTVNIFGNLIGDIIFPESQFNCCGGGSVTAANTGNGASSTNTANADVTNNDTTFQTNDATINNNLVFDATTGNNSTGFNTNGNSSITTGQANVDANVLNIANTNIAGGNMWLVLINQAGNWVGKLMGATPGASFAGSEGLEFSVGPDGQINVSNGGNGANSTNTANASSTTNNTTTQNNTATVNNTLRFNANTGGNDANFNTGGNSTINTGDANIIANLVNFVNNNITGGGKLFVTVVNVFGSWTGDFVGPGQEKDDSKSTTGSTGTTSTMGNNSNGGLLNNLGGKSNPTRPSNSSNSSPFSNETKTGNVTLSSNFGNNGNANTATSGGIGTSAQGGLLASTKVLAMHAQNAAATNDKKIEVNLAWLMLLVPLFALGFVVRKTVSRLLKRV